MRKSRSILSLVLISLGISLFSCQREPEVPLIATFDDHILSVMRTDSCTFQEAAAWVRSLGYEGIDIKHSLSQERLDILDSLGFKHSSMIATIPFSRGDMLEEQQKALDYAKRNHFDKIMLVPGVMPENASQAHKDSVVERIRMFYEGAEKLGIPVMIEDYDNTLSILYNRERMDYVFGKIPQLKHTFDVGNFLFAGDDVMDTYHHYRDRLIHIHLKDRFKQYDKKAPAFGEGIAPMREILKDLKSSGYKGWYVVELYGSSNVKKDLVTSIENLRLMLKE